MGSLARISDCSFTFQGADSPQLRNVNLTVDDADFIVLAGLTGSGKTTLLHQFMPSLPLNGTRTGIVELFGKPDSEAIHSQRIGYVPQRPREILIAGTLREELAIRLRDRDDDGPLHASDIVGFLGLSHLLDTNLANLSEGQAQLVALASVLATRPQLLLLDEPTASLDSVTRHQTVDLLRRLNEDHGITIIMAEHNLQDLVGVANRLVILHNGTICADDTPQKAICQIWGELDMLPLIPTVPLYFLLHGKHDEQDLGNSLPLTVSQGIRVLRENPKIGNVSQETSHHAREANNVSRETNNEALRVADVTFGYPNLQHNAVQEVSLRANYGEMLALIGQSGSGKSTLLQLLYGLSTPEFGTIGWKSPQAGRLTMRKSPRRFNSSISYLPQDVRPLLALEAGNHVHETEWHDDPLDYSVGQQQMRALQLILDQKRPVLLLDEPTQGLDATARQWVGEQLKAAQEQGALVIFSSHDPDFVATWATQAVVLLAGQVVAQGSPRQIVSQLEYSTTAIHRLLRRTHPNILTRDDVQAMAEP